jgi:hypothetical protein
MAEDKEEQATTTSKEVIQAPDLEAQLGSVEEKATKEAAAQAADCLCKGNLFRKVGDGIKSNPWKPQRFALHGKYLVRLDPSGVEEVMTMTAVTRDPGSPRITVSIEEGADVELRGDARTARAWNNLMREALGLPKDETPEPDTASELQAREAEGQRRSDAQVSSRLWKCCCRRKPQQYGRSSFGGWGRNT